MVLISISSCVEPLSTFDKLPPGVWRGVLLLDRKPVIAYGDDRDVEKNFDVDSELPFNFEIVYEGSEMYAILYNADERIKTENIIFGRDISTGKDTVIINFSVYDTSIEAIYEDGVMEGDWIVHYKENYRIPFKATHGNSKRFDFTNRQDYANIDGSWKVTFGIDTDKPFLAQGIFTQNMDTIKGTFLTETGDYRYLEGKIFKNKMYLSAFDGAHAFLFTGKVLENGDITGTFKSGSQYTVDWQAERSDDFSLSDPFNLTKSTGGKVDFSFENTEGQIISLSDEKFKNKGKIISVMGTWCPNCMDEALFLKEYFEENPKQNIELISIGFERYSEKEKNILALRRFKQKMNFSHEVLLGGSYSKKAASEALPFLDTIISYPTMVFLNKDNDIVDIYTGFNGPATPNFEKFKKQFEEVLLKLE